MRILGFRVLDLGMFVGGWGDPRVSRNKSWESRVWCLKYRERGSLAGGRMITGGMKEGYKTPLQDYYCRCDFKKSH